MEQSRSLGYFWTAILALPPLGALAGWWVMQQGMGGFFCFLTLMILAPLLIGSVISCRPLLVTLVFNISVAVSIVLLNLTLYLTPGLTALMKLNRSAPVFGVFILIAVIFSLLCFFPVLLKAEMAEQARPRERSGKPHDGESGNDRGDRRSHS